MILLVLAEGILDFFVVPVKEREHLLLCLFGRGELVALDEDELVLLEPDLKLGRATAHRLLPGGALHPASTSREHAPDHTIVKKIHLRAKPILGAANTVARRSRGE